MSVDLSPPSQVYRHQVLRRPSVYSHRSLRLNRSRTIGPSTARTLEPPGLIDRYQRNSNQPLSDDSYASAKSKLSGSVRTIHAEFETPFRQSPDLSIRSNQSTVSKNSLKSSTYKALQSPFANIKRFIKNSIPKQFGGSSYDGIDGSGRDTTNRGIDQCDNSMTINEKSTNTMVSNESFKSTFSKYTSDFSCGDSASIFNRSQTPPVCPPPPGELKSMCYMDSAVNYSNYDEFTRSRNKRLSSRPQSLESPEDLYRRQTSSVLPRLPSKPPPVHRLSSVQNNNLTSNSVQRRQQPSPNQSHQIDETESWQLASLPAYFERNLTTVFEDQNKQTKPQTKTNFRPMSANLMSSYQQQQAFDNATYANGQLQSQLRSNNLIEPPKSFDDRRSTYRPTGSALTRNNPKTCSNQSLASMTESILEYQRHVEPVVPASPYRFSFAQPLSPPACISVPNQNINGLPPRAPSTNSFSQSTIPGLTDSSNGRTSTGVGGDAKQLTDNNSSSGNSSNCSSSQLNVVNSCDKYSSSIEIYSRSLAYDGSGSHSNGFDNDIDTTLVSETSTLQGDQNGAAFYINKCAEFERTVATLKNKLISKEKELTDLQLSQLNNDYTIDKLKSQVNKLEKENGHLKNLLYGTQQSIRQHM